MGLDRLRGRDDLRDAAVGGPEVPVLQQRFHLLHVVVGKQVLEDALEVGGPQRRQVVVLELVENPGEDAQADDEG